MTGAYGPKSGGSYLERAHERWGEPVPDWVLALAQAADAAPSQRAIADRLGIAAATISAVIGNAYPGGTQAVEARVRGALMGLKVDCPVLGPISRNLCMDLQKQPFSSASPARAKLFAACRKPCVNYLGSSK